MHKVFVYGTLKDGYGNNRLLDGQKKIGEAITEQVFVLRDGGFPYCQRDPDNELAKPVKGEVWYVDDSTMQALDWLEGIPHHFQKTKVKVDIEEEEIYMYTVPPETGANRPLCQLVDDNYVWGNN